MSSTVTSWSPDTNTKASETTSTALNNATLSGTLSVTGDAAFDTNTLFVDVSTNRVGIGTTSPTAPLHIYGASGENLSLRIDSQQHANLLIDAASSSYNSSIYFKEGGSTQYRIFYDGSENEFVFYDDANTNQDITISSGNVTIAGDLTVTGNDIIFGNAGKISSASGYMLIQDTDGTGDYLLMINTQNADKDSSITFAENDTVKWNVGNDGSDSDTFKISSHSGGLLHTDTELTLDTSSNLTITGVYKGYQTIVYHVGIQDSDADGGWLSFHGQLEGATPAYTHQRATAPYNGYIEKIIFRSETAAGSTTMDIYKVGNGTNADSIASGTQVGSTVTVDMSSAHTAYTFSGGTGFSLSAGEVFAVKVDPTNSFGDDAEGVVIVRYLIS